MTFDQRGNLTETLKIDIETFFEVFVNGNYKEKSIRNNIFKIFETYLIDFQKLVTNNFTIWIDGSFISNKNAKPRDIDFVIFIDYDEYLSKRNLIDERFGKYGVVKIYGRKIDAYVIPIYPESHKKSFVTEYDKKEWTDLFSKTRLIKGQKYSKGFIKIDFGI
jgi:hypothetical protein